jgi:hypothetical protein
MGKRKYHPTKRGRAVLRKHAKRRESMTTPTNNMSMVAIKKIGDDILVVLDDMEIAKRGKDGTPQADRWVVLEPGFIVVDSADLTKLVIEFDGEVLTLPYGEAVWRRSPRGDAVSDPDDNGRRKTKLRPGPKRRRPLHARIARSGPKRRRPVRC